MLHIFNGDATARRFKETKLHGDILPWREALIAGPAPANLPQGEWLKIRAAHLAEAYGGKMSTIKKSLTEMHNLLLTAPKHDEVVLWFEFDLFCQTNLLQVLNQLALQTPLKTKISLICIDHFQGIENFTGLGQLNPDQLASLFPKRQQVTDDTLALAQTGWEAYTAPNPEKIETLLQGDTRALPFLDAAFRAHLQRFPALNNGIGLPERVALNLIVGGIDEFFALFPMFCELHPQYGLGDYQFWNILALLSQLNVPLLEILDQENPGMPLNSRDFTKAYFRLTHAGKAVLVGNSDNLFLNKVDYWLGGVHLRDSKPIWRWDPENQKLRPEK